MFTNGLIWVKQVEHQNKAIRITKNRSQQQIKAPITMASVLAALIFRLKVKRLLAMSPWARDGDSGDVLRFVDFQEMAET